MPIPTLVLPPELTVSKSLRFSHQETQLGDGYIQSHAVGVVDGVEEWAVSSGWLSNNETEIVLEQLKFLRGAQPFAWTPNGASRGKVYTCEKFEVKDQQSRKQITATFTEHLQAECEPYRGELIGEEEILDMINGIKHWLSTYTRDQKPFIINSAGLSTNSFHDVLGRGAYFTFQSCTTEGQFVGVRAAMYAYDVTGDPYWLSLAETMAHAAIQFLYPIKPFPPADWQTLDENNITVAHWLCNLEEVPSKAPIADDPLNNGYFNLPVEFVDGVGQIPYGDPTYGEKLSNVYRVIPMHEELLWQNVYAYPRYNPDSFYEIDYWVTDVCLKGLIRRFYADAQQPGGRQPIPTTEPVGLIKLVAPYTGTLKVTFMTYTGAPIVANGLYEPYPAWRLLLPDEALAAIDTFAWSYEAFKKLWEATGNFLWYQCMTYTGLTEIRAAQIENSSCWYKKYDASDPFRHPGSQVIIAPSNDARTTAPSRNYGGDKDLWLRLDVGASVEAFPSVEIQNFAVQPAISQTTIVQVEAACSVPTTLEVILSLSQNAFDFSQYYIARLPVPGSDIPVLQSFSPREFVKFNPATNIWNPFIADNPIYTYKGDDGESDVFLTKAVIDGVLRDVYQIELRGRGDYAGAGFVTRGIAPDLQGAAPSLPLRMFYRFDRINDGGKIWVTVDGKKYGVFLDENSDWAAKSLTSNDLYDDDDRNPRPDGVITNIELETTGNDRANFYVWWIGSTPDELPVYAQTYKAAVVSKVKLPHTLWCGNFEAIGSPSNELRYIVGANLFTVNVENKAIDSWRGAVLMMGYQDPYHLVLTEQWDRLTNQLNLLTDSQDAYQQANSDNINGLFYQGFISNFWDAADFVDNRGFNVFTEATIDPNAEWTQYFTRPLHSVAKGWYLLTQKGLGKSRWGKQSERITMRFLGFLYGFYRQRGSNQPPTNITVGRGAEVLYHEPATSSLIMRAALYANLAGGNRLITFGVLKASYEYIKSQYISSGNMMGSFAESQPEFLGADGITRKEFFFFWEAEILEALAVLHIYREQIRLPSCSAPLI